MLYQELQSEYCYLAPFGHRIDFRGVGAAGKWNKDHCSGYLKGHHFRLTLSPFWKHAENNGGSDRCPETTYKVLMHLYQTAMSFKSKKWNCANIGANLNSKIVCETWNYVLSRHSSLFTSHSLQVPDKITLLLNVRCHCERSYKVWVAMTSKLPGSWYQAK